MRLSVLLCISCGVIGTATPLAAQQGRPTTPARDTAAAAAALREERRADPRAAPARREGDGPFEKLIIRGATVIDGTGSPPVGPVDVVIERNRITEVVSVGAAKAAIDTARRPKGPAREIDGTGMYVLPGLVDLHVHQGTQQKAPESEYYNKLWLAHGITTVRGVPFASFAYSIREKERSAKNEI